MDERLNHLNLILEALRRCRSRIPCLFLHHEPYGCMEEEFKNHPKPEEKSAELEKAEIDKTQADAEKAEADADATDPTLDPDLRKSFTLRHLNTRVNKFSRNWAWVCQPPCPHMLMAKEQSCS